ncbi:hypothetical protein DY000_02021944 [Brassica cretica]|uniref:Uncharacterized protein n=1 Tax=Brassica cretica TaxID=69181 RepID=A0ABQ7EDP2_BRACR|nr:hypothetical protein DY000_02021944 [Brassica cretica]
MSSSNYFRSWIDRPHLDPNTRLLTEEYQRGITEFMGLVHRQPEAKTVTKFGIIMGKLIMNMVVLANLSQREVEMEKPDGMMEKQVRPYITLWILAAPTRLTSMFLIFHIYCAVSLHKSEDADKAKEWSKRKCSMYGNKKGRRMAECGNSSHNDFDKRPKL